MTVNLITAPAGAGKTQYVVEQICKHSADRRPPRILVILPSGPQLVALRERLGASAAAAFGVTLTEFHTLYHDLLDAADKLPRLLAEAARYRLVRAIIRRFAGEGKLPYFSPIAAKPGFVAAVLKFIADAKQARLSPELLLPLDSSPRMRDLAAIYAEYQAFLLGRNLADREGMGWLAQAALEADASLYSDLDYVAVDGFDEFNPTQLAILNLLAARVPALDVTLTFQPGRLAHARFERTANRFPEAARRELERRSPPRAAPLEHLEKYLFELNPPLASAESAFTVIEAPDRTREVRAIARQVKRLLLAGTPTSEIGVLFRRMDEYQSIVREVFAEYGIPFRVRSGMPLESNPMVAALMSLLALGVNDFPWRDTLDALRSPYLIQRELTTEQIAQIEQISREAVVVKGEKAWREAFTKPSKPLHGEEEDKRIVALMGAEDLESLRAHLGHFLDSVKPPERAAVRGFAAFVERLIGPDPDDEDWQKLFAPHRFTPDTTSLRVIECIRSEEQEEPELAARDLAALVEFKDILRGLVEAAEVLNEGEGAWAEFLADLQDAVGAAQYDLTPTVEGRVVISTVTQARGVPKECIFLGGLVESEFPTRAPEDPLLSQKEREALGNAGLPLAEGRARDETTLFYEAATLARKHLSLFYPYLDEDANPLYPSPYLKSTRGLFDQVDLVHLPVNAAPSVEDAASPGELAVSLTREPHAEIDRKLRLESPAWRHSLFARGVEARRESAAACDEYSGVMGDASIRGDLARKFARGYPWSASQFNEFGRCGFHFFARRLLHLEEIAEPEEGLDALTLGGLNHYLLEQTYREFARRGLLVTAETRGECTAVMEQVTRSLLATAPEDFGFRKTAWWEKESAEILRRLSALLAAEAERGEATPAQPFLFEQAFDFALALERGKIRVRGKIDRLDKTGDGGVVLVDYKSGSTKIYSKEVFDGLNLQLPVYFLAAERMGYRVSDAHFLHIPSGETSGEVADDRRAAWLKAAKEHAADYVRMARAGAFPVKPKRAVNGACANTCEYESLCRVGRWSAHKGEEPGDEAE
jgi:ATP-dependent helicase/nuclease subunit B